MTIPSQQNPHIYELLGRIAQGGMGSVYLARMSTSTGESRLVAVKRLRRDFASDKNFVALLSQEARSAAQIQHPNVTTTFDLTPVEGALSLVLDYVEGESLAALIKHAEELGESIPPSFAITIMWGVLSGIEAAHAAHIVHRDLSPKAILVGIDGDAKIVDLGLANARQELASIVERPRKSGYMPPEQLLGRPVNSQFDIYAAGVILWELLAGERFYASDELNAMSPGVMSKVPEPPSAFNPAIPPGLDDVVMRAIARDPYQRFKTAGDFANALEQWHPGNEDAVGAWVSRLAAARLASTQRLLDRAAEGERAWIESSVASIAGVERSTRSSPPSMAPTSSSPTSLPPLENMNPNERTVVMPYTYTPPAPPKDKASTLLELGQAKLKGMNPVLLVGMAAVVACVIAMMMKGDPEPDPMLAAPASPSDPASMPTAAAARSAAELDPPAEPVVAPEPTATISIVPIPSGGPRGLTPAKTSTPVVVKRRPPLPVPVDRQDTPIPISPTRQAPTEAPKAPTTEAPKPAAPPSRDYR